MPRPSRASLTESPLPGPRAAPASAAARCWPRKNMAPPPSRGHWRGEPPAVALKEVPGPLRTHRGHDEIHVGGRGSEMPPAAEPRLTVAKASWWPRLFEGRGAERCGPGRS